MTPPRARSTVVLTMNATTSDSSVDVKQRRGPTVDRLKRRREAPLRDATVPARPGLAARHDDGSHTAPHGDALLPHRKPAP